MKKTILQGLKIYFEIMVAVWLREKGVKLASFAQLSKISLYKLLTIFSLLFQESSRHMIDEGAVDSPVDNNLSSHAMDNMLPKMRPTSK